MPFISKIRRHSRGKRLQRFMKFLADSGLRSSQPLRIIDLGGTVSFWSRWWDLSLGDQLHVTLINNHTVDTTLAHERSDSEFIINERKDANDLTQADFDRFDLIFSNSFFEHLCSSQDQSALAAKISGSGKPYFIQIPNKFSPVDPHHPLAPFFAAYPEWLRAQLVSRLSFGISPRAQTIESARAWQRCYRPLGYDDLERLFPDSTIIVERSLLLPMSLIACRGRAVQFSEFAHRRGSARTNL